MNADLLPGICVHLRASADDRIERNHCSQNIIKSHRKSKKRKARAWAGASRVVSASAAACSRVMFVRRRCPPDQPRLSACRPVRGLADHGIHPTPIRGQYSCKQHSPHRGLLGLHQPSPISHTTSSKIPGYAGFNSRAR